MIIDADGHTQIPQEVFDNYLDKEFYRNRPRFVTFDDGRGFYLIEGRLITKPFGWGPGTPGSIANSTPTFAVKDLDLSNVPGRLADLDLEGIELQVIYPNVLMSINSWSTPGSRRPSRAPTTPGSPNAAPSQSGRLRFAAIVALQDPKAAAEELKHAVNLGAVGVMVTGTIGTHTLDHPDLYPFWETVEQLDVGVGSAHGDGNVSNRRPGIIRSFLGRQSGIHAAQLTTAMVSLVGGGIVDLFPKIRFGLLETGCGWLPYWVERMDEMHERGEKNPRMYDGILNRKTAEEPDQTERAFRRRTHGGFLRAGRNNAARGDQHRRQQVHHVRF